MSEIRIVKDNSDAKLDIIFVHGLKVDQEYWTSQNSVKWLETLLPNQVPKARILAFEYDEDAAIESFWHKKNFIGINADEMHTELSSYRRGEQAERPVIYVAHCLGGLVIQSFLIKAVKEDKTRPLVSSCAGLMLLGAPQYNSGNLAEAKKYFQLAGKNAPSDSDLQALSKHVLEIPEQFADFRQANQIKLAIFYEGAEVKIDDEDVTIVEESVAQFARDSPDVKMLRGNHHQIARFESEKDKDFKAVCSVLAEWVNDLPEPEEKGTVNNISNASFAGSTNHGYQLGQNTGNQTGFVFGR